MPRFLAARIDTECAACIERHAIPPANVAAASRKTQQCVALLFACIDGRAQVLSVALTFWFWLTPIVYSPGQLGANSWLVTSNPLTHVLDLVRLPLLNQVPAPNSVAIVLVMGLVGWTATFLLFARFRARVPFWL